MVEKYYEKICAGEEIRKNLISLRGALTNEKEKRSLAYLLAGDFAELTGLLAHEDPKVRKNAALILGEMESEDLLPVLFDAYRKEETLFVRPDYLQAMRNLDYQPYLPALKKRLAFLRETDQEDEGKKHRKEEIRALQQLILRYETPASHRFTGYDYRKAVILTVNRSQREATAGQFPDGKTTLLQGGVRVKDIALEDILPVRTYRELLFPIEGMVLPDAGPEEIGKILADGRLLALVQGTHEGLPPFCYRIELKSTLAPEKKGDFIRGVAEAFERFSHGMWINSTSGYELEIRLLQRKDGTYLPMVKFFTIKDRRFRYRKEYTAASMSPVNAALSAQLARPYLKKDAQILDPFCGVGTMLLERNYAVRARTMYGIDIFGEAVEKARINAAIAGVAINYINRDFFAFTHEYPFDEIITEFPQATQNTPRPRIRELYEKFFDYARGLLKAEAVLILYSTEPSFVRTEVKKYPEYRISESFMLNERNQTTLFVIQFGKKDRQTGTEQAQPAFVGTKADERRRQ